MYAPDNTRSHARFASKRPNARKNERCTGGQGPKRGARASGAPKKRSRTRTARRATRAGAKRTRRTRQIRRAGAKRTRHAGRFRRTDEKHARCAGRANQGARHTRRFQQKDARHSRPKAADTRAQAPFAQNGRFFRLAITHDYNKSANRKAARGSAPPEARKDAPWSNASSTPIALWAATIGSA